MASFFSYLQKTRWPKRVEWNRFQEFPFLLKLPIIISGVLLFCALYGTLGKISAIFSHVRPLHGGTLTEGVIGSPRFITPLFATSTTDEELVMLIYSGLTRKTPSGSIRSDLATYHISDDGLTYTFTIHPHARFSDNTKVTADDVIYTYTNIQQGLGPIDTQNALKSAVIQKINDQTIAITLPAPNPEFLSETTIGIMPMHYWQSNTQEDIMYSQKQLAPIGSGPFVLKTITTEKGIPTGIILERNEKSIDRPLLKTYALNIFSNQEQLKRALETKTIDMTTAFDDFSLFDDSIINSFHTVRAQTEATVVIAINSQTQTGALSNPLFRSALGNAIDKTMLIDTIEDGYGHIDSSSTVNSSGSSFDDLVKEKLLTRTPDGVLLWQGVPINITFVVESNSKEARIAQVISDMLKPEGIFAQTRNYESGIYRSLVEAKEAPVIIATTTTQGYNNTIPLFIREHPIIIKNTLTIFPEQTIHGDALYRNASQWFTREERVWNIF